MHDQRLLMKPASAKRVCQMRQLTLPAQRRLNVFNPFYMLMSFDHYTRHKKSKLCPPSIHSQLIVEQLIQHQYLPSVVQLTDSNIREEEQNLSHM
ncbi:hypothetical protein Hanom_Chr08g00682231 [Helianthus anomalus]